MVCRGRANSSALAGDAPVFDPQAMEDESLEDARAEGDDDEEKTTESAVHGVTLRDFAR